MEDNLRICVTKLNSTGEFHVLKKEINARLLESDLTLTSFSMADSPGKMAWCSGYSSAIRDILDLIKD